MRSAVQGEEASTKVKFSSFPNITFFLIQDSAWRSNCLGKFSKNVNTNCANDHRHPSLKVQNIKYDFDVKFATLTYIEFSFARYYNASNLTSMYLLIAYSSKQIYRSRRSASVPDRADHTPGDYS